MTIIDPLTVVNSTSCYSVDSWDSCSFIETPGVFEISKDPAIFFEHESHESYEWPLRGNTAGVWNLTNDRWTTDIIVDRYSVDSRTSSKSSLWMPRRVIYGFANLIIWQRATFTQIFYEIFAYTAKVDREGFDANSQIVLRCLSKSLQ